MTITPRSVRKSWNFPLIQAETLFRILDETLEPLGPSALVLPEGPPLHVRPASPADLATLSQAASLCHQYLKLRDGDVALLNDPFSGGTILSELTLVMGVCFESAGPEADLLLAKRVSFPIRFGENDKLDDQGVRIPPTPLASRGQVNAELLAAIASHPLAPIGLAETLTNAMDEMSQAAGELKGHGKDPGSELKKANFKRYFADTSAAFESLMSRLPLGATTVTTQLPGGETIKLQLEISEKKLHFDFAGTDASAQIGLTEHATLGACLAATAAALRQPIPFNAGTFEHFQVSTPAKTLLSHRGPNGIFRGFTTGMAALATLVQTAFAKLNTGFRSASSAGSDGYFLLQFDDGRFFSSRLAPGAGATRDQFGVDCKGLWSSQAPLTSLEAAERTYPLRITTAGLRTGSGGDGKRKGGQGELKVLKLSAPALLRWSFGRMSQRQDGADSGRAGLPAEIGITRASGKEEEIASAEGSLKLEAGDQIRLFASGGGGFGEPSTES